MELFTPFAGVLTLPDRPAFGTNSPVSFAGELVATIRWHRWTTRAQFEILNADGTYVLAAGSQVGFWGRSYRVVGSREQVLLDLRISGWGLAGRSTVTLPTGQTLTAKGNWSARQFNLTDKSGAVVAQLLTTSSVFSLRRDNLAFELTTPVLSVVQAVGLAQCMRAAVEAQRKRRARAAASS